MFKLIDKKIFTMLRPKFCLFEPMQLWQKKYGHLDGYSGFYGKWCNVRGRNYSLKLSPYDESSPKASLKVSVR